MKASTKNMRTCSLLVGAAAFALTAMFAQSAEKGPKDILHLSLQKKMTNTGVIAAAQGKVDIQVIDNGKKDAKQDVHIKVMGLEGDTAYQLAVLLNNDTNLTQVAEFDTKKDGNASLHFHDKGKPAGKEKHPLAAPLNPVSNIHEVKILDASGQVVLSADMTSPDKLVYLVKRDLSTDTTKASLHINANAKKGKVDLHASDLSPDSDYSLALNGAVVKTVTSDAKGKLKIKTDLATPTDILNLESVALLDSTGATVVSTTLP